MQLQFIMLCCRDLQLQFIMLCCWDLSKSFSSLERIFRFITFLSVPEWLRHSGFFTFFLRSIFLDELWSICWDQFWSIYFGLIPTPCRAVPTQHRKHKTRIPVPGPSSPCVAGPIRFVTDGGSDQEQIRCIDKVAIEWRLPDKCCLPNEESSFGMMARKSSLEMYTIGVMCLKMNMSKRSRRLRSCIILFNASMYFFFMASFTASK